MSREEVVVWSDGGARGNPGPAGYGVVVTTPGGEVLAQLAEGIGWATNNVAEYRGAIAGLEQALALGARRVRARADSLLEGRKAAWSAVVTSPIRGANAMIAAPPSSHPMITSSGRAATPRAMRPNMMALRDFWLTVTNGLG